MYFPAKARGDTPSFGEGGGEGEWLAREVEARVGVEAGGGFEGWWWKLFVRRGREGVVMEGAGEQPVGDIFVLEFVFRRFW